MTDVVAALIWDGDKFLACQRPAHKARGLLWEFVGGKVEPGETKEQALIRECREKLDITVQVHDVFMELNHEYPDLTIRLTLYHATVFCGTPKCLEHNAIRWITTDEIPNYRFCPADRYILRKLMTQHIPKLPVRDRLLAMQDIEYKEFVLKLTPTIEANSVIGVRTPALRRLSKQFAGTEEAARFLQDLPHKYYEEDNLHAFLISETDDLDATIAELDRFLPFVNNWATCDAIIPRSFKVHSDKVLAKIQQWLHASHIYTVRFAIGVLLRFYLDDTFCPEYLHWVSNIKSGEYYINMMIAWYFATALAKQYKETIVYFENNALDLWTHNKAIQKAIESYRIPQEQKDYLRTLKIKNT